FETLRAVCQSLGTLKSLGTQSVRRRVVMFSKWNIEGLQQGESVLSVVRIFNEDVGITHRLVLTDHHVMTISSPKVASVFGLGRFVRSKVLTSMPLTEVESASFEKTFRMEPGGAADYYSTLHIQTTAGNT